MLKEDLWSSLQQLEPETCSTSSPAAPVADDASQDSQPGLSFQDVIFHMQSTGSSASSQPEVSVHLCFICMLHLANEHGLQITGVPALDSMNVSLAS